MTTITTREGKDGKLYADLAYPEFTDYTQKIRRNLVAASAMSLFIWYFDLGMSSGAHSMLGIEVKGLTEHVAATVLLILVSYWLGHFLWCAHDYLRETRIRLTGVLMLPYYGEKSDPEPQPFERNRTIVSWVYAECSEGFMNTERLEGLAVRLSTLTPLSPEWDKVLADIRECKEKIKQSLSYDPQSTIEESLNTFDNWVYALRTSQTIRWLVVELALPVVLGVLAIFALLAYSPSPTLICIQ